MRDQTQLRQLVEQAREHHARHRHAALKGPAQHLPDFVFRFIFAGIVGARRRAHRVHPHRQMVLVGDALEHREEIGIVERPAVDAGEYLNAARAKRLDGTIHFRQCRRRIVHWQRCDKGGKLVGMLAAHLRHAVIRHPREPRRLIRPAQHLRGWHGQRQHLLHLGPLVEHRGPRVDVPQHAQSAHALDHAGLFAVLLHQLQIRRRHDMVVDIDLDRFHCVTGCRNGATG